MVKFVDEITVDLNALDHIGINRYGNSAVVFTESVVMHGMRWTLRKYRHRQKERHYGNCRWWLCNDSYF